MPMKRSIKNVRDVAKAAAVFVTLMFLEFVFFRSFFMMIPIFLSAFYVLSIRCQNCGTRITDHRIAVHGQKIDLQVLEACPVCGEPML
jgi:hypothetical protein